MDHHKYTYKTYNARVPSMKRFFSRKWLTRASAGVCVVAALALVALAIGRRYDMSPKTLGHPGFGFRSSPRSASALSTNTRDFSAHNRENTKRNRDVSANFLRYDPFFGGLGGFGSLGGFGRIGGRSLLDEVEDMLDTFDSVYVDYNDNVLESMIQQREAARDKLLERLKSRRQQREGRVEEQISPSTAAKFPSTAAAQVVSPKKSIDIFQDGLTEYSGNLQVPAMSVDENPSEYIYSMDAQGIDRDHLKLSLRDNMLFVEGQKMVETDSGYYSSSFKRSFSLPKDVNLDTIKSQQLADGTLMITAEKLEPLSEEPKTRDVPITRLPSMSAGQQESTKELIDESKPTVGPDATVAAATDVQPDGADIISKAIDQNKLNPGDDGMVEPEA